MMKIVMVGGEEGQWAGLMIDMMMIYLLMRSDT